MPSYSERKQFPYTCAQLFTLVADVEDYPIFLPWCIDLCVRKREGNVINADMTVGFKVFREQFSSTVTLEPNTSIVVEHIDGPFSHLENRWRFNETDAGCEVDFFIDFEFKSRLLSLTIEPLFLEAVRHMVNAFERRAVERFS